MTNVTQGIFFIFAKKMTPMKNYTILIILSLFLSCQVPSETSSMFRNDFNTAEQKILHLADSVIRTANFTTLITVDKNRQPRARVVAPFLPEKEWTIWMATNPKSRKVAQLKKNATTTLHYFDKSQLAYVSLMGKAYLVNDSLLKTHYWKEGWEEFYPNKEQDMLLIKFVPETVELVHILNGFIGDEITWKPHQVRLRE